METTKTLSISAELLDAYRRAYHVDPHPDRRPGSSWELLVVRYADGRAVCNCGEAWYMRVGETSFEVVDGHYRKVANTNPRTCQYGCQANQRACKVEIGQRVVAELGLEAPEKPLVPYAL